MTTNDSSRTTHEHVFLGRDHERNERRVWLVIALTAGMMLAEIVGGAIYGSMALLADGWHMSTHAGAMLVTALAYRYARRNVANPRFTFGTGKLGDLAGFASAVALALIALLVGWESLTRLARPVSIRFEEAIALAVAGLLVNLASAWLLRDDHAHHGHHHEHRHGHHERHGHNGRHAHDGHDGEHRHASHDNNLRAAYLHVLADALTSVLAIAALLLGHIYGWLWTDPAMGVVGALVIARWSWKLIVDTANVLLDATPRAVALRGAVRAAIEPTGDRITDLHVWQVGPDHFAAIISLVTREPRTPEDCKARLAHIPALSHVTVEMQPAA